MRLIDFKHLPRDARDTLFLLAVIAWVIMPQVTHLPIWCTAFAAGVLIWRGRIALKGHPLPNRWWLLALLIITVVATFLSHRTLLGRDAGVTLIIVLLTLKTLELRARRDALVIFFLGFFTLLTGFFQSQSLITAIVMLVALLGLLTALINAHRPVGHPTLTESAVLAGKMALLGAPIMLALFMLFPRFAPLWGLPSDATAGRSGLSGSMKVGAIAALVLDDRVAMRVRFEGAPPPQSALYFRGPVLSQFDGSEWTIPDSAFGPSPASDLIVSGQPVRYETTLEPNSRPWLLTLDAAPNAPELPSSVNARLTSDLQWLASRPITDLLRYRAESYPQFRYGLMAANGQPRKDFGEYLRLPPDFNPRTLALAKELKAEVPESAPEGLVQAALGRLRTGGYQYTLEPGVTGLHSADEFWFDTKAGFCEHIASAFVILMRAAGVPSRIVTGFQGGEVNSVDGYWTVRNADAHAWAEVWLADRGWVRVDPTASVAPGRVGQFQRLRPPDGMMAGAIGAFSPTLLVQLRATWEAINNGWNQWVLNYTQSRQLDLLKNLGFDNPSWEDLGKVLAGLLTLAALAGSAWAIWERGQHDPWQRLLGQARKRLLKAGVQLPPNAPPRELARLAQASEQLPEPLKNALQEWLLALERARYAPNPGSMPAQIAKLQSQFKQIAWPRPAPPRPA
ncbi:transglutaminaseTgpA domain-containing protein [Ottowia thiooxydans]|uniref:transglutaminase family protein n=1 Tax=Ottowia thiooxydans TaxID=219182 RepID=UPI0003FE9C98|nr:DUF3488 and transglutaminase-like domain-containing protein [Ottowia thiooxydans]